MLGKEGQTERGRGRMWDKSDSANLMSTIRVTKRNLYLYAHCCGAVKGPSLEMLDFTSF